MAGSTSEQISRTVEFEWSSSLTGKVFRERARIWEYRGERLTQHYVAFEKQRDITGIWVTTSCPQAGLVLAVAERIKELRQQ